MSTRNPSSMLELHCPQCGYDLRGIPEYRCPECGFAYDRAAIEDLADRAALVELAVLQDVARVCGWLLAAIVARLLLTKFGISLRLGLILLILAILVAVASEMLSLLDLSDVALLVAAALSSTSRTLTVLAGAIVGVWLLLHAWPHGRELRYLTVQATEHRLDQLRRRRRAVLYEIAACGVGVALVLLA